ncbi:hypothetical protein DVV91_16995 [Clostridium botulinum]|uniref:hypothetical protein n=1 Tax=Clostridium botulinum TaxID=1491 RepID=UPI0019678AEF|nr:hypothetical protein [Clostridium botulinum]MBN1076020.1 hypothetical protein [Clostridium botulinum]
MYLIKLYKDSNSFEVKEIKIGKLFNRSEDNQVVNNKNYIGIYCNDTKKNESYKLRLVNKLVRRMGSQFAELKGIKADIRKKLA